MMVCRESDDVSHRRMVILGRELCTFDSQSKWVNKASSWLGVYPEGYFVCLDSLGRVCDRGGDFQRAEDDGAFPVTAYAIRIKEK